MNKSAFPAKNEFETETNYQRRLWFIQRYLKQNPPKQKQNLSKNIAEADRYASMWVNSVSLKCQYPLPVMERILSIANNSRS